MMIARKILKLLLMIAVVPIVVALTLFVWICLGLVYVSGLILLLMAFLISQMGLPLAAIWLLGKVQDLKFAIQDWIYG